jgi:hypothetical protein
MGAGGQQVIQRGGLGNHNSITAAAVTLTNAVHDHKYDGFFHEKVSSNIVCAGSALFMHFISRTILHHFCSSYNNFFKNLRNIRKKSRRNCPKGQISPGFFKKV